MSVAAPEIDTALVAGLIAGQFPQWAGLPLTRLAEGGSDHVIHRLGETMSVRLPRGDWAAGQARKEHLWLPLLAPHLPLAVPEPLGLGTPDLGHPWHWSVHRWLDGGTASADGLADPRRTAVELAGFLAALQRAAPPQTLAPGRSREGMAYGSLAERDSATRAWIAAVTAEVSAGAVSEVSVGAFGAFDARELTEAWEAALSAPDWDREPVWFHGDFHTGNLLTVDGRLSAVIDFGGLGTGDPACDLLVAWTLLDVETRPVFRAALGVDDATWERGRGWALTTGLGAYAAYAATSPRVARQTRRQITEVLGDGAAHSPRGSRP